jgi:hypothetical protein
MRSRRGGFRHASGNLEESTIARQLQTVASD